MLKARIALKDVAVGVCQLNLGSRNDGSVLATDLLAILKLVCIKYRDGAVNRCRASDAYQFAVVKSMIT